MTEQNLAFVFPGQGSQTSGMLSELMAEHGIIQDTFDEASASLGFDLWQLVAENPEDRLNLTVNTQPALLTSSVAIWRLWQELGGPAPALMAGHSLGEYSALVCANAISLADAVTLVADRGKYMQEAVSEGSGTMAAILGLQDEEVIEVCEQAAGSEIVSAANFNSRGQVVIAGHTEAVKRAMALAKERGAKRAMPLAVSVPSHCALMKQAAARFAERMSSIDFRDANVPIVQNVDAEDRTQASLLQQALLRQLHEPVHWWRCVKKLESLGVTRIIECGPGKVLTGLIRRIGPEIEVSAVNNPATLKDALNGGGS